MSNMRIFVVLSLFVVVRSGSVEDLYGRWVPVAFYPITTYIPACFQVSFAKVSEDVQCTCADGKNTTALEFTGPLQGTEVQLLPVHIGDSGDVAAALNVSCRCGSLEYRSRKVAKLVSTDYFVLYEIQQNATYTDMDTNSAQIFARNIPSFAELRSVMKNIEDLISRSPGILCTKEYHDAELQYKAQHKPRTLDQSS
uniref:Lipocalin/cytosolic fatty-acid binding domain-containing protein n=1 Tax=Heliothis virescens TaxID=7102 RepID=A0A2A4JJ96_HELVI